MTVQLAIADLHSKNTKTTCSDHNMSSDHNMFSDGEWPVNRCHGGTTDSTLVHLTIHSIAFNKLAVGAFGSPSEP